MTAPTHDAEHQELGWEMKDNPLSWAPFPMKGWTTWSFGVLSSLGCSMMLWLCDYTVSGITQSWVSIGVLPFAFTGDNGAKPLECQKGFMWRATARFCSMPGTPRPNFMQKRFTQITNIIVIIWEGRQNKNACLLWISISFLWCLHTFNSYFYHSKIVHSVN